MCTANAADKMNLYSDSAGTRGKFNRIANPAGYATHKFGVGKTGDAQVNDYLAPPEMPAPPPEMQEGKEADMTAITKARKNFYKGNTGTLLTSPSGVSLAQQNSGATLLGG